MHFIKQLLFNFHVDQKGSVKERREILLVGLAIAGILFTFIVIFSGGAFFQITSQPVDQNTPYFDTNPGSALSGIINPDKIPDSVTHDISALKNKVKIPATERNIEISGGAQQAESEVQ